MLKHIWHIVFLLFFFQNIQAQTTADTTAHIEGFELTTSEMPEISLNTAPRWWEKFVTLNKGELDRLQKMKERAQATSAELKKLKKLALKKESKNDFFGMSTKKGVVRSKRGRKIMADKFRYIKYDRKPPALIEEKMFFDTKKKRVVGSEKDFLKDSKLLHGNFVRTVNGFVVEQGQYYLGVKHGVWERFNATDSSLRDKRTYYQGFLEDSEVTYFDSKQSRFKEIIPVHNGIKDGEYFRFHPSGRLAEKGMYKEDARVGVWAEYRDTELYRRHRETQYAKDPFDENYQPTIIREWDEKGKLTTNSKGKK